MYYISVGIGSLIVFFAVILIRNEFKKSLNLKVSSYGDFSDVEKRKLVGIIEELEEELNNLNRAFYEIVGDLEGKYSIHEKQIELMEERLKNIETKTVEIKKEKVTTVKHVKVREENEEVLIDEEESIKNKIIMMKNQGLSNQEIAKELDIGIGELNLIINMYRK